MVDTYLVSTCVFFTLNRSFYASTSSTTSVWLEVAANQKQWKFPYHQINLQRVDPLVAPLFVRYLFPFGNSSEIAWYIRMMRS